MRHDASTERRREVNEFEGNVILEDIRIAANGFEVSGRAWIDAPAWLVTARVT